MRKLPVALVAAFALELVVQWGRDAAFLSNAFHSLSALVLTIGAANLAIATLLAIGLYDLAQRSAGHTRRALQVALGCAVATLGVELIEVAREAFTTGDPHWDLQLTVFWALNFTMVVSCAVAAANRLALVAVAVTLATWLPDVLHFQLLDLLPPGIRRLTFDLAVTLRIGVFAALLASISTTLPTAQPVLALRGLSLATQGFYLRIVGFGMTVLLVLVVLGNRGRSSDDLAYLAVYGGFMFNAIAFAMVGLGALKALRSSHDGLDSLAMGFAAVASLWCAGATLNKLAAYYGAFHGAATFEGNEVVAALELALPIVATIGGVFLTTAIARFARGRGDQALATSAAASGVGYAMLMIASTGIAGYLVADAKSLEGMVGMMLIASLCGLVSQIIIGRLCKRTEDALADAPGIPTATVV